MFSCVSIIVTSIIMIFFVTTNASAQHVHNEGVLNVVVEDNKFVLSMTLPAGDIIGFERAPKNKEEKLQVDRAISRLKDIETIFAFPEEAKCKLIDQVHVAADVILKPKKPFSSHKKGHKHKNKEHTHKHDEHKKHHHEDSHADIDVSYMLECQKMAALDHIKVLLFEAFPKIHKLNAQFVSETQQLSSKVTAKSSIFKLRK